MSVETKTAKTSITLDLHMAPADVQMQARQIGDWNKNDKNNRLFL